MCIIGRHSRRIVNPLVLLAALVAVSGCAIASPVEGPAHVRSLWQLDEEAELDHFGGFWTGVFLEETAEQPGLAVVWSLDGHAFWPVWRIQLVAVRGMLAGDDGPRTLEEFGSWFGMEGLTLASAWPTPGHQYEACLSYDPELGGLSVLITDVTTGSEIVATSVTVPVHSGPFHLATGLLAGGQMQKMASAGMLQIEPGYVPWGVQWHVAVRESIHETSLPALHLERTDDAFLELSLPHPVRGEFELSLVQDDRRFALGQVRFPEAGHVAVPLQVADWPLGRVIVELRYGEHSMITFSRQRSLVVGRLATSFQPLLLDEDQQVVQTTMFLHSDDEMVDVPVRIQGQWMERVWDPVTSAYSVQPAADPFTVFSGLLDVAAPDGPGEVALSIPVPQQPGLWQLQVVPVIESDVRIQAHPVQTLVFICPPAQRAGAAPTAHAVPRYAERWVYVSRNLTQDQHVEDIRQIAITAATHGLNGLVWAGGFDSLSRWDSARLERLKHVKSICDGIGIELIPLAFSAGYGGGVLGHNPNLAAALPVRDALYVVQGSTARLVADPPVGFPNGDLGQFQGHRLPGFNFHDQPGQISFVDQEVYRSAPASIRFESMAIYSPQHGHARIMAQLPVQPRRQYRFSAWVRTQDLEPAPFLLQVYIGDRAISSVKPTLAATQGWTQVTCTFNSLDATEVRLYAGLWGGKAGRLWLDDLTLEEVGLRGVVRRPGAPVTVTNDQGTITYVEGQDYARTADPNLQRFSATTPAPDIAILPQSRLRDGDRLRVSFYHAVTIGSGQTSLCMSEPELYEYWAEQVGLIHRYLAPSRYLLSMDEIRAGGSCQACQDRGMTMGEILGDSITRLYSMIREANPEATIYVWSDMLDPNHNARDSYYMVEGDYTGSWQRIPKDIVPVCWHYSKRKESLSFFSGLGFETLAGAYYDGDTLDNPRGWLEALDATPGARGIMYTTWQNKYELLPGFGDLVSQWK